MHAFRRKRVRVEANQGASVTTLKAVETVKVLVVDDSAFMRTALTRMINSVASLHVVDTAQTGLEAIDKIRVLHPDVVTLDIEMPGLNGLDTLRRIMTELPRPVIMVSSLTQEGAVATLEALEIGAFDCVAKQRSYASLDIVKVRDELVAKIIAAAGSCYESGRLASRASPPTTPTGNFLTSVPSIVAIGTSTGGPRALQHILPMLPADLPVPVLVVQHMPVGFTGPFAKRLNAICNITVEETTENAVLTRGHVYIAAAGSHVSLNRHANGQVVLHASTHPADALHIPSVDVMMTSVANTYHGLAMGIILTGMGADGVIGMRSIFEAGGLTLGQDEQTCVVYGMPRCCAQQSILRRIVPLHDIPNQIMAAVRYRNICAPTQAAHV